MMTVSLHCSKEPGVDGIIDLANVQSSTLQKEVERYCDERGVEA
jgi:hypothetical protein